MRNRTGFEKIIFLVCLSAVLAGCGDPREKELVLELEVLMKHREYAKAMEIVKKELRTNPTNKTFLRQRIILLLKSEQADLAYAAYRDFVSKGAKDDPVLVQALEHADREIRTTAAKALSIAKDPQTRKSLEKAASDPDEQVRRSAVNALGQIKNLRSLPVLTQALKDPSWFVRGEAASALGLIGDESAIPALMASLQDGDEYVRFAAGSSVVELATEKQRQLLQKELQSSNIPTQVVAAMSLAKLGDASGAPLLRAELQKKSDLRLRRKCMDFLVKIKDVNSLPIMHAMLNEKDEALQCLVLDELGKIPDKSTLSVLKKFSENPSTPEKMRSAARQALRNVLEVLAKQQQEKSAQK